MPDEVVRQALETVQAARAITAATPSYEEQGRRVWVTLPYGSPVKDQIKGMGAHWDPESKRWWADKTKSPAIRELIDAENSRRHDVIDRVQRTIQTGVPIKIPYEREDIRHRAKGMGAVWHPDSKQWFMPNGTGAQEIQGLVDEHNKGQRRDQPRNTPQQQPRPRTTGPCDECGRPSRYGPLTHAPDSSGIGGMVCPRCSRLEPYERSYA